MAQPPKEDSFLARWSKRKRTEQAAPASVPEQESELPPENDETITEEELAALPALEDFTPQTDIRPFLRKGVPQVLRNAALRKIWLLTPAIRDHKDPAVDYAWDWNTPGGVPGDGAAPTAERAAQMLRDLVNPRRSAEDENTLETDAVATAEPASGPAVSAAQKRPESSGETVHSQVPRSDPPPGTELTKVKENQSTNDCDAPRRRHGGALPS